MTHLSAPLAKRLQTAAIEAAPHRRQSMACELGRCIDDLAPASDPAAQTMAETLNEIRTLLLIADRERSEADV